MKRMTVIIIIENQTKDINRLTNMHFSSSSYFQKKSFVIEKKNEGKTQVHCCCCFQILCKELEVLGEAKRQAIA
jgi:hypothetical protein